MLIKLKLEQQKNWLKSFFARYLYSQDDKHRVKVLSAQKDRYNRNRILYIQLQLLK